MLNENIKNLRKSKGLSQEELAMRLHVVRQTVSKWENGLSVPDAAALISLAAELDTSAVVLLGETVPEREPVVPPPNSSVRRFALGETKSLRRYPWAQCTSTRSSPAFFARTAAAMKLSMSSYASLVESTYGVSCSLFFTIGEGAVTRAMKRRHWRFSGSRY